MPSPVTGSSLMQITEVGERRTEQALRISASQPLFQVKQGRYRLILASSLCPSKSPAPIPHLVLKISLDIGPSLALK